MKSKIFHTGNIIIAAFVIAALSMIYLAYLTTTVHFDLAVEGDYYAKEVELNDRNKARKMSLTLGKDFEVKEDATNVHLSLPPRISNNIQNGKVEFYCYSDSKNDKLGALESTADGHYTFAKSEYMPGKNYNIIVSFEANGNSYYKEVRLD